MIGSPKLYCWIAWRMYVTKMLVEGSEKMKTPKSNHCYVLFLR